MAALAGPAAVLRETPAPPTPLGARADGPDVVHIGYHRTASTFLQNAFFAALDEHYHLPSPSGWHLLSAQRAFAPARARDFYAETRARNARGRALLVSSESLSGSVLEDDLDGVARLHRVNPNLRVIVVLRRQTEILPSLYHLYVKQGQAARYPAFLGRALDNGKCDYPAMVERLYDSFGRNRVCVALYEDLQGAPQRFFRQLCAFLEVPLPPNVLGHNRLNHRAAPAALRTRRRLNALFGERPQPGTLALRERAATIADRLARLGGPLSLRIEDPCADPQLDARIRSHFAAGNRRLAVLLGRSLEDLGYPV